MDMDNRCNDNHCHALFLGVDLFAVQTQAKIILLAVLLALWVQPALAFASIDPSDIRYYELQKGCSRFFPNLQQKICGVGFWGILCAGLVTFSEKYTGFTKLLLAGVFFALAGLLLLNA